MGFDWAKMSRVGEFNFASLIRLQPGANPAKAETEMTAAITDAGREMKIELKACFGNRFSGPAPSPDGKRKSARNTPITMCGSPSRRIGLPIARGSAPSRRRQSVRVRLRQSG
jgi:hypothetical protein